MKFFKKKNKAVTIPEKKNAIDLLKEQPGLWRMSETERKYMTISCKDTDYIKKVKSAGSIITIDNTKVQHMFNGIKVEYGGYHGDWMGDIIRELRGHHEPQEEKVFYEVMNRLGDGKTMIELGSFWAYYSIWFNLKFKDAKNICCEPDPNNLNLGMRNAKLNKTKDIKFIRAAGGSKDNENIQIEMESRNLASEIVKIRTVDSLMKEHKWSNLDILHMDIQGIEEQALIGALETIKSRRLRFLFVSTHHYLFSNNPNTHQNVIDFILDNGGHIITSHTVAESFSGDGLVVASFSSRDADFVVETSINHTDKSLFRSPEEDLAILVKLYNKK